MDTELSRELEVGRRAFGPEAWVHAHRDGGYVAHPPGILCDQGDMLETEAVVAECNEAVTHPSHYGGDTTYECIKVIDAWGLGFNLGSVLKYVCRADHKGSDIQDLEKAVQYLQFEIEKRRRADA